MPGWLQVFVVAIVVAQTAIGVLVVCRWRLPTPFHAEDREDIAEMLRLLRELRDVFREWPDAFGVLDEIVAQFRTNTGHSMRDLLDRLERAATVAARASEASAAAVSRLSTVVTMGAATGLRIEEQNAEVAVDLRLSHERADAVTDGAHGESADAASRSPEGPTS